MRSSAPRTASRISRESCLMQHVAGLFAQNYGNNKKSDNVANRWLARGVEMLLHK